MKKFKLLFCLLAFFGWINASATVYLIQPGGGSAEWTSVAGTIVDLTTETKSLNEWYAATAFDADDEIWLINGTYVLTDSLMTQTTEKIYGGFEGGETAVNDRAKGADSWSFTNASILDGNNAICGIVATTGAIIDGVTVQNCAFTGTVDVVDCIAPVKLAGGSVLQNSIVQNNTIAPFSTGTYSGGVYLTTSAKLLNSYVYNNDNTTTSGGGVTIDRLGTVDGCTIEGNKGTGSGGIFIATKEGGAVVSNSIITSNEATTGGGGGINIAGGGNYTSRTVVTVSDCTISFNIAKTDGGGIYGDLTVPRPNVDWNNNPASIKNCIIDSNTATGSGGGFAAFGGAYTVDECTISNNRANITANGFGGGGVYTKYIYGSNVVMDRCILKGNSIPNGQNSGSAIYCDGTNFALRSSLVTGNIGTNFYQQTAGRVSGFYNCTFADNLNSSGDGVGLYLGWASGGIMASTPFTNCIFYNVGTNPIGGSFSSPSGFPAITYCAFSTAPIATTPDIYASMANCITTLAAADFTNAATGDYTLASKSAAIDKGTTIAAITTDLNGKSRPMGDAYDIGAYEFDPTIVGIENASNDNNFTYFVANNSLQLQGLTAGAKVKVYNTNGLLVASQIANAADCSVSLFPGFYILSIVNDGQDQAVKFVVK